MNGGVLSGGVIFVVAALLWAAVLVPAWIRRREFKAAEQNAVRLQRTLRVLAETAEVPTEVRVEATAREALAQEKLLRTAQRRQQSERQATLAEARAEQMRAQMKAQQAERIQANLHRAARLSRPWMRALRAISAVIALCAAAAILVGFGLVIAGQGVTVLIAAALAFLVMSAALVLMAPGRVKLVDIPSVSAIQNAVPNTTEAIVASPVVVDAQASAAAHAANQAAASARLLRARSLARARAEQAPAAQFTVQPGSMLSADPTVRAQSAIERSVQATAAVSAESTAQEPAVDPVVDSTTQRLRSMGVVGDTSDGKLELDAALRRLRTAS